MIFLVYVTSSSTLNNTLQLFGLLLLFIFILIATYFTSKFVGGIKLGQVKKSNFKVIETYKIAPNKFLQIIHIGKKYIVISVNKDDIKFITELSEEEIICPDSDKSNSTNFKEIFLKSLKKQNKDGAMITKEEEETKDISNFRD